MGVILPTIAFFGAGGGCAGSTLAKCLKSGYTCRALARNKIKLVTFLTTQYSVTESQISNHLTVIEGNIRDEAAVTSTLFPRADSNTSIYLIIYGIGATPSFKWNCLIPSVQLDDPTICADGIKFITFVLKNRCATSSEGSGKPALVAISTTGTTEEKDVPSLYIPLYSYLLHEAHTDKLNMEKAVMSASDEGVLKGHVIVKTTLLTDGEEKGTAKVKSALQGERGAIGYSISRKDVGAFMFEKIIEQGRMENKSVIRLTY
ncbi:hypothetical protein HYALB_00011090 [Hymenoscyphus albidus]|uniref:NAD(P)-binding domain-containing protein n=1 Tax=Hymenoscyphus albidus TaxID=595503 RepID=A0A9N9LYM1_9HELO|nr:hypothetical protein HYALB_00011090 [Hymenoscyphus albidus]